MGNRMIGFLGADKYDILLYLSRLLTRLHQKVLLVDYSENRALTYCIPIPGFRQEILTIREIEDGICRTEVKMKKISGCISYQGFDFLIEPMYCDLMALKDKYDVILVDFGFQVYSKLLKECSQLFLCIDQQLHHIMQLKAIKRMGEQVEQKCYLLFRQVYDCKISFMYLLKELNLTIDVARIFQYYQESSDMKYCIDSQYNHTFQFTHISKGLKSCILFILRAILPQLTEQQRKSAYRTARTANAGGGRN